MDIQIGKFRVRGVAKFEVVPDLDDEEQTCDFDLSVEPSGEQVFRLHTPRAWEHILPNISICQAGQTMTPSQSRSPKLTTKPKRTQQLPSHNKTTTAKPKRRRQIIVENNESEDEQTAPSSPQTPPNQPDTPQQQPKDFNVTTDDSLWFSLDRVQYKDKGMLPKRDHITYLDMHGQELKTYSERTEFVVTEDGEVCSINGPNFAMFSYWEHGRTNYAPGKPREIVVTRGELYITIEWLKPSRDLTDAFPTSFEEIVLRGHSSLPASAFCANLAHLTDKTRTRFMSDYYSTLRSLDRIYPRAKLGEWGKETGATRDSSSGADLMDMLEFYYIKPEWIWRSCLGEYIWNTFVQCAVNFGGKPNLPLVEKLFNASSLDSEVEMQEKTNCGACGKHDVVKNRVSFSGETLGVGCTCLSRIVYIFDVGQRMRILRKKPAFDLENARTLCTDLCQLQKGYQDQQDNLNAFFSSQ